MNLNQRIKDIRKSKTINMSQADFGSKIGVTAAAISRIESGERNITDQMVLSICREFNVNETWLRTGEGEMFVQVSRDEEIAAFLGDVLADKPNFRKKLISVMARMTVEEWEMLERKVVELMEEMKKPDP